MNALELIAATVIVFTAVEIIIFKFRDYLSWIPLLPWVIKGKRCINKFPEYESDKNHVAVIIANNYGWLARQTFYADGIDILIDYLRNRKQPYKVYERVDKKGFTGIINNKKVSSCFIFGHGQKHGLRLGREIIYYCELKDAPKKNFVGQCNCGIRDGRSLLDYIGREGFVLEGYKIPFQIRRELRKRLKPNIVF